MGFVVGEEAAFALATLQAGNAAFGAWARAGAWSVAQRTDGFLPETMAPVLGASSEDVARLEAAGLLVACLGGWQLVPWLNRSARDEERRRALAAERQRRARTRRGGTPDSPDDDDPSEDGDDLHDLYDELEAGQDNDVLAGSPGTDPGHPEAMAPNHAPGQHQHPPQVQAPNLAAAPAGTEPAPASRVTSRVTSRPHHLASLGTEPRPPHDTTPLHPTTDNTDPVACGQPSGIHRNRPPETDDPDTVTRDSDVTSRVTLVPTQPNPSHPNPAAAAAAAARPRATPTAQPSPAHRPRPAQPTGHAQPIPRPGPAPAPGPGGPAQPAVWPSGVLVPPKVSPETAVTVQILAGHLAIAGLPVRWDTLTPDESREVADLVDVHGDAALVAVAQRCRAAHTAPPVSARAWLGHWRALPAPGGRTLALVPEPTCTDHPGQRARTCAGCRADRLAGDNR